MRFINTILTGISLIKKGQFTMKFTKKHAVAQAWYRRVAGGIVGFEEVPELWNLQEVVKEMLDELVPEDGK
ncbi:hypothetical protein ACTMS3_04625 [Streptococcus suis]|uniref:hypothetical protein n=1 Tax=Streptococcus suis TaxID=1307 RepID=UPI000C17744F|nr:hypothetical protein [Streptococcus suis]